MEPTVGMRERVEFQDSSMLALNSCAKHLKTGASRVGTGLLMTMLATGMVTSELKVKGTIDPSPKPGETMLNQDSGYPDANVTNGNDPISSTYIHLMGTDLAYSLKSVSIDGPSTLSRIVAIGTSSGRGYPSPGSDFKVSVYSTKDALKTSFDKGDIGTFSFIVKQISEFGKESADWGANPTYAVELIPDPSKPVPKIPAAGNYYIGAWCDQTDRVWGYVESNVAGPSDLFVSTLRPGIVYTVKELSGQIGTYKTGNMAVNFYVKYDTTTPTPPSILSQVSINIAPDKTGTNVVIGSTANTIAAAEQFAATNPASAADLTNYVAVLESQLLGPGGLGTNWVIKTAELGTISADKFLSGAEKFTTPKKVNPPEFYRVGFKRKE